MDVHVHKNICSKDGVQSLRLKHFKITIQQAKNFKPFMDTIVLGLKT